LAVATDCDEGDVRVVVTMDSDEGDVRVVAMTDSGAPLNDLVEEMNVQGRCGGSSRKPSMSSDSLSSDAEVG
jgi:hypothetical protein